MRHKEGPHDKAAAPSGTSPDRHGPFTPEVLHPPAALAEPASAAAAAIGSAARSAAGAVAAAVQRLPAGVGGPFAGSAVHTEVEEAGDGGGEGNGDAGAAQHDAAAHGGGAAHPHGLGLGGRLESDIGLAGLAHAAGHAWLHVLHHWQLSDLVHLTAGLVLVAGLVYSFFLAPNSLGVVAHDLPLLSRLFYDNALTFVLFNLLGLVPFLLGCLMWPGLRSQGNEPPLWPFLAASYFAGAFALLSYLALAWRPRTHGALTHRRNKLPLKRLVGPGPLWLQRLHEGRLMPFLVTASIAALVALSRAATPATWAHFGYLFSHSRAVHVMTLDLTLLTLLSPFLVVCDARARGVRLAQNPVGAVLLGFSMLAVPWVGPGVYLLLRPITQDSQAASTWFPVLGYRPWAKSVRQRAGGRAKAAADAARGRAVRGGRRLGHAAADTAAAAGSNAAAAGSNALAAGSDAAARVVAAARVPLPQEQQLAAAAASGAEAAGRVAGTVAARAGRGWWGFKQVAVRFFTGGYPQLATAAGSACALHPVSEDFSGDEGMDAATAHAAGSSQQQQQVQLQQLQQPLAGTNPLGESAYLIPSTTPTGGYELLYADDYNEASVGSYDDDEDDSFENDVSDDMSPGDDAREGVDEDESSSSMGEEEGTDDEAAAAAGEEEEADVTFDAGAEAAGGWEEEMQEEVQQGVRRGGFRVAKEAALLRLAELAHQEHPRTA